MHSNHTVKLSVNNEANLGSSILALKSLEKQRDGIKVARKRKIRTNGEVTKSMCEMMITAQTSPKELIKISLYVYKHLYT